MNASEVRLRANALLAVTGTDKFISTLGDLYYHSQVSSEDVCKVAAEYLSRNLDGSLAYRIVVKPSTTREQARDRMKKRHDSIMTFRLKQQAMRGRSAA